MLQPGMVHPHDARAHQRQPVPQASGEKLGAEIQDELNLLGMVYRRDQKILSLTIELDKMRALAEAQEVQIQSLDKRMRELKAEFDKARSDEEGE